MTFGGTCMLLCASPTQGFQQLDARDSLEAAMLQCLQGDVAVANDGNMVPFCGWVEMPPASKAPTRKRAQRHKADVGTAIALHGSLDTHAGDHDFFTFRRGMRCANTNA